MTTMNGTSTLTSALERAWQAVQERNPEAPDAVIVVAPASKNGRLAKWGHYADGRWSVVKTSGTGPRTLPEVMISAEGLQRSAREVFRTLLHEAVHGIAAVRGVQDTSRGGRYHNRKFAGIAIEVGLVVEKDSRIGHVTPDVTDETAREYAEAIEWIEEALVLNRKIEGNPRAEGSKGSGTNGLVLICGCEPRRKMRMAESALDLGPVWCGVCGDEFRPA
jgi:hypothetical protein